ncbi:MAG: TonB-dependent siderophore receptor [Bacteroidetes bacterium QS_8_64_10]|nr:MAG: TonB-dependent siderophore receptor [Bacteroidetes bacterium QS_8_64_10]
MYRTLLLLFVLFFIAAAPLHAQQPQTGAVEGRVTSAETGEALAGVNVSLEGTTQGASTDDDGRYEITGVAPGSYTLVASFLSYATERRDVTVEASETTTAHMALSASELELQEVEVTGRRATTYDADYSFASTKVATAPLDVPQAVNIVTKEVIDAQQGYTLNDVTRNVSGVNTFSGYNDLTARGFRNSSTRLVNGLKTEFGFWHAPILPHIERTEFIKGPASALYGNANPGGTINMVTKKPLSEAREALSASAGSYGSYRATADFTGSVNDERTLLYRLNVGYDRSETFRFLQGHESYLVAPSISFLPGEDTRVNADLVYSRREGRLDRGQAIFFGSTDLTSTPIDFSLSQPGDFQNITDLYLTLSLRHNFTNWLTFNSSYLKYRYDENLAEHRTSNAFLPSDSTVLQLAFIRRKADRTVDNVTNYLTADVQTGPVAHKALVGFDYYQQDDNRSQWGARGHEFFVKARGDTLPGGDVPNFDLDDPTYSLDRDPETYNANWFSQPRTEEPSRRYTYGAYVQDQVEYGPLQLLLGLRHEWYTTRVPALDDEDEFEHVEQTAWLPRVGIVAGVTDQVNLYGTFTQGFEPQSAETLQQPERFGGPFDPERSTLLEAGAKGHLFDGRLSATLAAYQITKRNVLVSANAPGNPDLLEQRGEVRSRGLEVDATGSVTPSLRLTANYALNEAIITESADPAEEGTVKENAPRHQGGFWGKYTLLRGPLKGVGFGLGMRAMSERNTFDETLQLPSHAIFDASLSYRVNRFAVTAYADNVFDDTYWTGGYSYGRIYPGAPRSFRVKVAYSFD